VQHGLGPQGIADSSLRFAENDRKAENVILSPAKDLLFFAAPEDVGF
jgi:hypothetical protein